MKYNLLHHGVQLSQHRREWLVTMADRQPLNYNLFTSFTPGGPPGAMWDHPESLGFDYLNLDHWVKLARAVEDAGFNGIFFADHSGVHDIYEGSWATAVREAVQFPAGDPFTLVAALAGATEHLGFSVSGNVIAEHPYVFARKLSTLDHLTRGRIGWNIVTSFQPSAWKNLGFETAASHGDRYRRAEEYIEVLYKLWEGSWQDDAVVRNVSRRVYADPSRVHDINHVGDLYSVPGIHTMEPSPQRVPVLFQAGTSDDGRDFAARNAEAMFMFSFSPEATANVIADVRQRMARVGRCPEDMLFYQALNVVVGSTEEEARKKDELATEWLSSETTLAFSSSTLNADLASIDPDTPMGDFQTEALQGVIKMIAESAPDPKRTFREYASRLTAQRVVGTPEQIADEIERWHDAGVGGINMWSVTGTNDWYTILEELTPILKKRGLMRPEHVPGTLREKLFHGVPGVDAHLNKRHPAASYRQSN